MPVAVTALEQRLLAALKEIAAYQTPEQLHRRSHKDWGCGAEDAIEMAYDNVLNTAKRAVKGVRLAPSK